MKKLCIIRLTMFIILVSLLIVNVGFTQEISNYSKSYNIQNVDEYEYRYEYKDGKKIAKYTYLNDKLIYKHVYNEDGVVEYKYEYVEGKRIANYTYYKDEQGNYRYKYKFVYDENGKLVYKNEYVEGKRIAKYTYYKDEQGNYRYKYKFVYDENGKLVYKNEYKEGKRIAKYTYYKDDIGNYRYKYKFVYDELGILEYKNEYVEGKRIAKYTYYKDEQGNYRYKYKFVYDENGKLEYKNEYKEGKRIAKYTYYKDEQGNYRYKYKFVYDENGKLEYKNEYKEGKRIAKYTYYKDEQGNYRYKYKYVYDKNGRLEYKYDYINAKRIYEKTVYLTFDDGPSNNTIEILNILKRYNIKATFFVCGRNSEFSKNIYKRIVNEGHAIGNHTYSHAYTNYASVDNFMKDFYKLENLIYETTGVKLDIMRFPWGSNNRIWSRYTSKNIMGNIIKEIENEGYTYFDWNIDSRDTRAITVSKSTIVNAIKYGIGYKNDAIILFHDTIYKTTTVEALPEIINYLSAEGYKFDVLSKRSYSIQFALY